jgi:hypothetical protein
LRDKTDREKWDLAIAVVTGEFARLSPAGRDGVAKAAREIASCKQAIHAIVEDLAGSAICASCGGECCRTGKYHFTVADLLVYLANGRELFIPCFTQDACPYLGPRGCLMDPGCRPFNCITFNCERVECFMEPQHMERFIRLEEDLRTGCRRIEELFGSRYRGGLLMSWERNFDQGRHDMPGVES